MWQGLCSHLAHLWGAPDSVPRSEAVRTPKQRGLCSHLAHLWATSYSTPRSEAVGTPEAAGVMYPPYPLVGHF